MLFQTRFVTVHNLLWHCQLVGIQDSNEDVPLLNTTGQFWLRAWKLITIRTWFLHESNYTCVGISQNMTKVAPLSCVAIMVIDLSIWLKWLNYSTKYTLSKFQVSHPWSSAMHARCQARILRFYRSDMWK